MFALMTSTERENSQRGEFSRYLAAALIGAGLALASVSAQAAPGASAERHQAKSAKDKVTTLAAKDPEVTSSIQARTDEDANCARSRQRLFVEGEGWIVRRVTTCY